MSRSMRVLVAVAVFVLTFAAVASAQTRAEPRPFCRFVERDDGGQVDVLVATYTKGDATVTLLASLHVADAEHYAALQQRFATFDPLLYELVADTEVRPYPGMESEDDWFSALQGGMGRGVGLVAQVEHIDYRQPNFVHADMTPAQWEAAIERAGSSFLGELFSGGDTVELDRDAEAKLRPLDVVAAFRSGRGVHELRIAASRLIASPEGQRREPTVIIEARNERCLEVLQEQLATGKARLGIYYGAAHMEHLERRLVQDLGWSRTGEEWLRAWDNRRERFPVVEKGLQQKRYRARGDVDALTAVLGEWAKAHAGESPTWATLRATQPSGALPGRADGVDPWGRHYELRTKDGDCAVRCLGSDGVADTADDPVGASVRVTKPGFFDWLFSGRKADKDESPAWLTKAIADCDKLRRSHEAAVARAKNRENQSSLTKFLAEQIERVLQEQAIALAECQANVLQAAAELRLARHGVVQRVEDLGDASRHRIDPWGKAFRLVATAAGEFAVHSDGPDGKPGTADDVVTAAPKK
jgi:hypothetical protein